MRYNLKNRPKYQHAYKGVLISTCLDYRLKLEAWFEGFEKELRERQKNFKANDWVAVDQPHISIKEILGE